MSSRRVMTEFTLFIADDWTGRAPEVLNAVQSAGGEVISVDEMKGILDGRIQSMDLPRLEWLACVRELVEGISYVTCRFPGGDDHRSGCGLRGGVHQGIRARMPKRGRVPDTRPAIRPSARQPKPGTAARLPARPLTLPGRNSPAPRSGHLDCSQRLLWQADDWPLCTRAQRRPVIPLGVRLAYGVVLTLGVAIATHTAMDHRNLGCLSMVHLLSGSLLAALATLAACGACRYPLVRHACTGMGLWLAVSPCLLQQSFRGIDMALGLAAFLFAGCAAETLGDT